VRAIVLAAAVAILVTPGLGQAQDSKLADPFRTLCLANGGNPEASIAQARSEGFVALPASMVRLMVAPMQDVGDPVALWRTYEGGVTMLITGHSPMPTATHQNAGVCALVDIPGEPAPAATLESILGVGEPRDGGEFSLFVYAEERDGHRRAVDLNQVAEVQKLMADGRLRMAVAGRKTEGELGMAMLLMLTPEPK
jgi:hypothetical protein